MFRQQVTHISCPLIDSAFITLLVNPYINSLKPSSFYMPSSPTLTIKILHFDWRQYCVFCIIHTI